jgi:hypothetical protein
MMSHSQRMSSRVGASSAKQIGDTLAVDDAAAYVTRALKDPAAG